ncbi:DNA polymerase IV [Serpentinicella sp. ANB-PHB4]|uniref:DNA polymerase Y family protein n=1 Tax=Serpentinicella sp. ANB-PHB4 TaxID=3074076 RepID=UPI00285CD35C|nr:DNA polymerase IV [Serpentinicella sp. ANB-PHB4]MDR5659966.1 DNA polymerase IV [Serpentinicella sp. ANB-PHB4]
MKKPIIMHIDVNSAYLSWEAAYRIQQGDSLDLREIPSVIGGNEKSRHGIVLAKSMPAKKYRISTGETLFSARQKCPNLVVVPPRYQLYMACSKAMVELLYNYSPIIQRYSIDEVFMDCTSVMTHYENPLQLASILKEKIKSALGFTVNIGIGHNKLLAKMASEFEKPDKIHTLYPEEIPLKMWPLSVRELFMVGPATARKLESRGITTIEELAKADPKYLQSWLKSQGLLIWQYANGIENSPVKIEATPAKGIGNSTTTAFDVTSRRTAHMVLLSLVETVSFRLRESKKCAQVISVSIKNNEFKRYSHQMKMTCPTDATNILYECAKELFNEMWQGEAIRHLGVQISHLCANDFFQMSLFEPQQLEKQKKLDHAIDTIRLKYGRQSVVRSCFLNSDISPLMGGVIDEEDYPMMSSFL